MFDSKHGKVVQTSAVDEFRCGEALNINVLEGYDELDLGIIMRVNESFIVQVAADNITDEEVLTESDPRTFTAPNGRFIMPRNIRFSVGYEF